MATFSKRHYEAVAKAILIAKTRPLSTDGLIGINVVQYQLLCVFNSDNPKFDADRFNKACEPGEGK